MSEDVRAGPQSGNHGNRIALHAEDMCFIYLDPQGVVDGHPLTSKGLLMDTLSVVLVDLSFPFLCF